MLRHRTCLLSVIAVWRFAAAASIYVDPKAPVAADSGPGSRVHPLHSLAAASSRLQPGDTCFLRDGTYRETLRPSVSGFSHAPITYIAFPGEKPEITGTDIVTGPWKVNHLGLYRVTLPAGVKEVLQVFRDGVPLPENTWPALHGGFAPGQFHRVTAPVKISASRWCLADSGIPMLARDGYWQGASIWILFGVKTSAHILPIDEHRNRRICFDHFSDRPAYSPIQPDGKFSYFAILKRPSDTALLEPGQWSYLPSSRALYLRCAAGDSPDKHRIECRTRLAGFAAPEGGTLRNVRLEGIDFRAATPDFARAESCSISRSRIRYVTPFFSKPPPADRIMRSLNMADPRWRGVNLEGRGNALVACQVDGSWGDGVSVSGAGNRVASCSIANTDWIAGDFAPVSMWDSLHTIEGNFLGATGRSGLVHVDAAACRIVRNRIAGFGLLTDDFGGTNTAATDGRGTEIVGNRIGPAGPQLGKFPGEPARFAPRLAGIYLDESDRGFLILGNMVRAGYSGYSLRLNGSQKDVQIRDNAFLDAWGALASYDCEEGDMVKVSLIHNLIKGGLKPSDAGCGTKWTDSILSRENSRKEADTALFAPDAPGSVPVN